MKVEYRSGKVKEQCTDIRKATRLFGGDRTLALKLLSRINALEQATVIQDIIVQPLDDEGNPFIPCNIDEISGTVRIVEIREVSKHYE